MEQVHELNYRTFVREIPQHADTGTGRPLFQGKVRHYFHTARTMDTCMLLADMHFIAGVYSRHFNGQSRFYMVAMRSMFWPRKLVGMDSDFGVVRKQLFFCNTTTVTH